MDLRRLQSETDDLVKRIERVSSTTPYVHVKDFASKLHTSCDTFKFMEERLRQMHHYGSVSWRHAPLSKRNKATVQEPNKILVVSHTLGDLGGNAQGSSMARCKAHCRLPITDNWTFLLALTTEALLNKICRSQRFLKGVALNANVFYVDGEVTRNSSMDREIGEWCSYNFAVGSFQTKKLYSRLFSREVECYWFREKSIEQNWHRQWEIINTDHRQ